MGLRSSWILMLGVSLLGNAACSSKNSEEHDRAKESSTVQAAAGVSPRSGELAREAGTTSPTGASTLAGAPLVEPVETTPILHPVSYSDRPSVAVDPIVVPDCRLVDFEKQEVPSQRDGVLLLVGTEIKPGEQIPPERLVVIKAGDQERRYRRLKEGDTIEAGQLLALLDDRLARDDYAIKQGEVIMSEAELQAADKARDDAKDRYLMQEKLRSSAAASEDEVNVAKLAWYKNHWATAGRKEALGVANLELHLAQTVLGMYEIRSTIPGVIKRIYKNPGEAVKSLEPILEVRNPKRLRAEGLVEEQHLPHLREGMGVMIESSPAQGPQQTFNGHLGDITGVAVSKNSKHPFILSASEDGTVRAWDRSTRHECRVWKHPVPVRALACTTSGTADLCLAGMADGSAWVWDLDRESEKPVAELKDQHHGAVTAVAFRPDGTRCATGGDDHEICLWDSSTGNLRYRFPSGHLGAITSLQFISRSHLFSAGQDNTVRLWEVGEQGARLEATFDHRSGDVPLLGTSPDGGRFLFDQGNTLQVLSLPRGASEGVLQVASGAANFTTLALFSPDGSLILTAGTSESRLQLWRAPTDTLRGYEVRQLISPGRSMPTCAAFAPDGSFLVTGTRDRQVLVWPIPPKREIERQFPAEITLVEQGVESSARQVRICAEISNPDGLLVPGTTVTMILYPKD